MFSVIVYHTWNVDTLPYIGKYAEKEFSILHIGASFDKACFINQGSSYPHQPQKIFRLDIPANKLIVVTLLPSNASCNS